jgi:hypothetical protein
MSDEEGDDADAAPLGDLAKQLDEGDPGADDPFEGAPDTPESGRPVDGRDDTGELSTPGESDLAGDADAPLGDIAEEVQRRRQRRSEASTDEDDLFEEVDVGEVDSEELWDSILGEDEPEEAEGRAVGAGAEAERVGSAPGADDRPEHRLPKEKYCQRCPYLTAPPTVACGHDGTDIVEVPDSEHFVVRGCPFAEQEDPDLRQFE